MPASFAVKFNETNSAFNVGFSQDKTAFNVGTNEVVEVSVADHTRLINRDVNDQHPINAVTKLAETLEKKIEDIPALTNLEIELLLK